MAEGVIVSQNKVYLSFGSGASVYTGSSDKPDRIVKHLHVAQRSALPLIP